MHSDALKVDGSPGEKVGGSVREYRRRLTRSRRCVRTIWAPMKIVSSSRAESMTLTAVPSCRWVLGGGGGWYAPPNGEVAPAGLADDLGVIIT